MFAAHLCKRANLIPSLQPTDMSSDTPRWFGNGIPLPYMKILGEDGTVDWLEYLPDGRRVVTGSRDGGTVRVWNLESGKQEGPTMEHGKDMNELTVTRDGTKVVSSGWREKIRVWNVESHKLVEEWTHPDRYPTIALSPDDRFIAAAGNGDRNVAIYNMEGRLVDSIEVGDIVYSMCFSPDRNKLRVACSVVGRTLPILPTAIASRALRGLADQGRSLGGSKQIYTYVIVFG